MHTNACVCMHVQVEANEQPHVSIIKYSTINKTSSSSSSSFFIFSFWDRTSQCLELAKETWLAGRVELQDSAYIHLPSAGILSNAACLENTCQACGF